MMLYNSDSNAYRNGSIVNYTRIDYYIIVPSWRPMNKMGPIVRQRFQCRYAKVFRKLRRESI